MASKLMNTQAMKEVVNDIMLLNELVVNPDKFCWGEMTEEEADDHFNNVDSPLYDDWGDKSFNMIMWIKDLEGYKTSKEEELIECHDCGTMSQLFAEHQGVSMGGIVYDFSIGKCCEKHY